MTESDANRQDPRAQAAAHTAWLIDRQADARRAAISDKYARFYAPLAIGSLVLAFLPLLQEVVEEEDGTTTITSYGTIFDMAGRPGGGAAVIGILLLGALVLLLAIAAVRAPSAWLPVAIAGVAALIALMLITKPGTGTPTPELTDSGSAGLGLMFFCVALGLIHAIHLIVAER